MLLINEIENFISNSQSDLSPQAKALLYFCYNPHYDIDLPFGALELLGDIPEMRNPPFDCLRQEAPKLLALFVRGFNPNLTRQLRVQILRDILKYCTNPERALLLGIIANRQIPGIKVEYILSMLGTHFLDPIGEVVFEGKKISVPESKLSKPEFKAFRDLKSLGYPPGLAPKVG